MIFELTAQGVGKQKICRIFEADKVATPAWIQYQRTGAFAKVFANAPEEKKYQWCVHANRNTKHRPSKDGTTHIFSGLVKCADCGKTMSLKTTVKDGSEQKTFDCSTYKKYGPSRCSGHHISYNNLYAFVLSRLQFWITAVKEDKEALYAYLSETMADKDVTEIKQTENKLKAAKKKLEDIDRKLIKLFEDRDKGVISEKNYLMMVKNYEEDQVKLEKDVEESENTLNDVREVKERVDSWFRVIGGYKEITELNADVLNEFIEKILIHKPQKDENGNRIQKIDICYRFIGNID